MLRALHPKVAFRPQFLSNKGPLLVTTPCRLFGQQTRGIALASEKQRYFGSSPTRSDPSYIDSLLDIMTELRKEFKRGPASRLPESDVSSEVPVIQEERRIEKLQDLVMNGSTESVLESFRLLNIMSNDQHAQPSKEESDNFLNQDMLFALVENWRKCWTSETIESTSMSPSNVLKQLDLYEHKLPSVDLNTGIYNNVIAACCHRKETENAVATALEIFGRMLQESRDGNVAVRPNSQTYNLMIQLLAKTGLVEQSLNILELICADRNNKSTINGATLDIVLESCLDANAQDNNGALADRILERMIKLSEEGRLNMEPSSKHYSHVIQCWAKSRHPQAPERIEAILVELEQQCETHPNVAPTTIMYNVFIDVLAQAGRANEAEACLEHMCRSFQNGRNKAAEPNTRSFNTVLKSWAQLGEGQRAEELLDGMAKVSAFFPNVQPDIISFNCAIDAWAKSKERIAGKRAKRLLHKTRHGGKYANLRPNTKTYTSTIDALAKSGNGKEAEKILWNMCDEFRRGNTQIEPTTLTFNAALDAIARSGGRDTGERAENLLQTMYKLQKSGLDSARPDVISYNSVLYAYGRSGHPDAGKQADHLFSEMLHESQMEGNSHLSPDSTTYGSIIYVWAQLGDVKRAQQLLNEMRHNYHRGSTQIAPDDRAFNPVIDAWSQLGEGQKAEKLLSQMQHLYDSGVPCAEPTLVTYNSVIHAWAKSGRKDSGEKAEALLHKMKQHGPQPDIKTYGGVMNAWARKGNVERTQAVLNYLSAECQLGNSRIEPDAQCFNILLGAVLRSKEPDAGERADKLIERMEQLYQEGLRRVKPDKTTYQTALWCWQQCSRLHPRATERISALEDILSQLS